MGKSTAAEMLRRMQIPVHDSDAVARALIGPGGAVVGEVSALVPQAYDTQNNSMNRDLLGCAIFADPALRVRLESIIHPRVVASQADFIRAAALAGRRMVVLDIPLLYETGAQARLDKVIVVTCPAFLQRRRVLKRPGMTEERFKQILDAQMSDREKRCRADFVVQTGLGRGHTMRALRNIVTKLNAEYHHDSKRNYLPSFNP
jgi:dephospho-CoA kinase